MTALETLYIDPDEEIPSIISRLKVSNANFLVFVIPQRAVVFSSVITMRLFKKEADRLGKDVFVVTQDEQGFDMARRVGFVARKSLDELPFSADRRVTLGAELIPRAISEEKAAPVQQRETPEIIDVKEEAWREKEWSIQGTPEIKPDVQKISVPDMSRGQVREGEKKKEEGGGEEEIPSRILQPRRVDVAGDREGMLKPRSMAQALSSGSSRRYADSIAPVGAPSPRVLPVAEPEKAPLKREVKTVIRPAAGVETESGEEVGSSVWGEGNAEMAQPKKNNVQKKVEPKKDPWENRESEEKLQTRKADARTEKKQITVPDQDEAIGSRAQWVIAVSFFVILGMIACIGVYLQSPEADIVVHLKKQSVSGDANYTARADGGDVATKFLDYEDTVTMTGDATGAKSSSGTKARGTVVLYNAFSKESQPLVATTRLQSSDGKIFRIVQSVTIPGFSEQDGQTQPGSVEVEVQADDPGQEGNIDPTKFTIPGFSGGPKAEKIYAESKEAFHGGGSGDGSERSVSQGDVVSVKKKIERKVRDVLLEKAKTDMESGMTSDDLIDVTFAEETSVPTVGTVAKTFDLTAKVQARYAVFSDADARAVAMKTLGAKNGGESAVADTRAAAVEYGKMSADFEKKTVDIKMFVTGDSSSGVSLDAVRDDILGKNESELQAVVEKYPQIAGFEVNLRKSYFQRVIPKDPGKVHITEAE